MGSDCNDLLIFEFSMSLMASMTKTLALTAVAMILAACATKPAEPIFLSGGFNLTAEEMERLTVQAEHGDADACERISNYHSFLSQDDKEAIRWMEKASKAAPQDQRLKENLATMKEIQAESAAK